MEGEFAETNPNPTDGIFQIELPTDLANGKVEIVILGIDLRTIQSLVRTRSGSVIPIDISRHPAGLYWVIVNTSEQQRMLRIQKF